MRLIDADELLNQLNFCESKENKFDGTMESICNAYFSKMLEMFIVKAPTIEAEPVEHGEWIWDDDGYLRCSRCKQQAPVSIQYQDEPITEATKYCPHCGAKMDLKC